MDYERISNDQFEEIMDNLLGKSVWLEIQTETVSANIFYEEFEFLVFEDKYQFGHLTYLEEREYDNLRINQDEIADLHRNVLALSFNAEQVRVEMVDETILIVEYNY